MSDENIINFPKYRKGDIVEVEWKEVMDIKGVKFNGVWSRFVYIEDILEDYGIKESDQVTVVASVVDGIVNVSAGTYLKMERIME